MKLRLNYTNLEITKQKQLRISQIEIDRFSVFLQLLEAIVLFWIDMAVSHCYDLQLWKLQIGGKTLFPNLGSLGSKYGESEYSDCIHLSRMGRSLRLKIVDRDTPIHSYLQLLLIFCCTIPIRANQMRQHFTIAHFCFQSCSNGPELPSKIIIGISFDLYNATWKRTVANPLCVMQSQQQLI